LIKLLPKTCELFNFQRKADFAQLKNLKVLGAGSLQI